ncbi:MAG: alpha-ribazole phosphatase family protein [Bacteroidales bacterium]|nr:alpha-ribazole phosphatase family protein [Bacteroidales bacterium]
MEVVLVRHTSVNVPKSICYGQTDVEVSESFIEEAKIVKRNLAQYVNDIDINSQVFSSPLKRCRKLASYCGFDSPLIDNKLMEMNFGEWEMQKYGEINDPQLEKWFDNWLFEVPTRGESFIEMIKRVSLFIDNIKSTNLNKAIIFTHAGVIACARVYAGLYPADKAFSDPVNYGQIVSLNI